MREKRKRRWFLTQKEKHGRKEGSETFDKDWISKFYGTIKLEDEYFLLTVKKVLILVTAQSRETEKFIIP